MSRSTILRATHWTSSECGMESKYFDSIPHSALVQCVARRIVDRDMLRLIKMWLKVPVQERDENGRPRVSGGKGSTCGTPQGGSISPLLANLYMNRFLKYWRITGRGEVFRAQVVTYADDFVILSCGCAAEARDWTRSVMTRIGLTLDEGKTSVKQSRRERVDFLGYSFGPHRLRKNDHEDLGASPSTKRVSKVRQKVGSLLEPQTVAPWTEVRDRLNRVLRGWPNYFGYGTRLMS